MNKQITDKEFRNQICSIKSIAVTGFRWSGTPQLLLRLIRKEFDASGEPNGLTIMFTSSATDPGLDHLAHPDLLACSFGSYYGSIPEIRKLVQENKIKGYSLPQGQLSLLFREIGRGSPGLISKVGMDTYVDPRLSGGKLNNKTIEDVIDIISIDNVKYLFYKSKPVEAALIRGSIADKFGNISMMNEPVKTEFLSMAQAARSSQGKIFVQVSELSNNKLSPNIIDLPSHLVDGFILTEDIENDHRHTNKYTIHEGLLSNGDYKNEIKNENNDPLYKQQIGLRALKELSAKSNVILGQGVPEIVGVYARQSPEKFHDVLTFMESGVIGGIPERRPDFGVAFDPSAFLTQDNQFVGFNGGHIDMAILSFAQFDSKGNVNVSVLGDDYFGCGGYIDICHRVKKILFVGAFTAKGLELLKDKSELSIKNEGKIIKAVQSVDEITFSPKLQKKLGHKILIITERCVFEIKNDQVFLVEISKGINLERDILNQMEFEPVLSDNLQIYPL
ncbi:MAG: acyl CoA:acetate/3-ketoacid CoA transferase [Candidatus Marinimicrobia bacterium]|nr:acyl CoA:acetate/3-ketoacid CoA transferase [Candidatus Neomarinimicrobiota bacterium]|tara:strand:+ start:92180 stop:93691 length:1512 start_codon:yes stop_codon:yes gene_type:complete